jgi:Fe2+ or Zn2+ uptake regulation protein
VVTTRASALYDELRARGGKLTPARRAVLDVLSAATTHLTADQLLDRVHDATPDIHRATVYRTVVFLSDLGIVEHTHLGHGPAVYHLADDLHHHLVCEVCGDIVEAPVAILRNLDRRLKDDYGFEMRPLHFAIVGRCRRCSAG